jgi:hypothetical protein
MIPLLLSALLSSAAPASAAPVRPEECWPLGPDECARQPACKLEDWTCDYVPPGKTPGEACPNGGKGSCAPKTPWELCCPLDSKGCLVFETACRPKPWTCLAGKGETCIYGGKGACSPRKAANMVSEPRCDLKTAAEGAKPAPKPDKPAYLLMGFQTQDEYDLYILDLRRKNKLIGQKDYERELKKLKPPKTGP